MYKFLTRDIKKDFKFGFPVFSDCIKVIIETCHVH